jgi:serine/threonine protein kinase
MPRCHTATHARRTAAPILSYLSALIALASRAVMQSCMHAVHWLRLLIGVVAWLAGGEYDGYKVDMWSCGVVLYCMTECRFPFTKAGNHGCGGPDCYTRTPGNLELMRHLQAASYPLKPERSAEYRSFLSRLLCVDVARRYTAAEALKDPWILGDDWSPDSVAAVLSEMNTTTVVVPTGFEPEAWLARVRRVMSGEEGKEEGEDAAGSEEEPMECEEDDQF